MKNQVLLKKKLYFDPFGSGSGSESIIVNYWDPDPYPRKSFESFRTWILLDAKRAGNGKQM